jgi:hypothetical protein
VKFWTPPVAFPAEKSATTHDRAWLASNAGICPGENGWTVGLTLPYRYRFYHPFPRNPGYNTPVDARRCRPIAEGLIMPSLTEPFEATGSDGKQYTVDVVFDPQPGALTREVWFTGREAVERREDGIFVIVGTGVELTPETRPETHRSTGTTDSSPDQIPLGELFDTPQTKKRVRCAVCRRKEKYSATELLQFTQSGWPKCCDEVMVLDESTEETPALAIKETSSP